MCTLVLTAVWSRPRVRTMEVLLIVHLAPISVNLFVALMPFQVCLISYTRVLVFCLEASGAQYVCKCANGYIEAQDGSCITCASVLTAEGGTGSSSSSKLFATGSTTSSCSCGNNARPNVSTQLCECNTNAVVTSEYFNLGKIKAQNCIS